MFQTRMCTRTARTCRAWQSWSCWRWAWGWSWWRAWSSSSSSWRTPLPTTTTAPSAPRRRRSADTVSHHCWHCQQLFVSSVENWTDHVMLQVFWSCWSSSCSVCCTSTPTVWRSRPRPPARCLSSRPPVPLRCSPWEAFCARSCRSGTSSGCWPTQTRCCPNPPPPSGCKTSCRWGKCGRNFDNDKCIYSVLSVQLLTWTRFHGRLSALVAGSLLSL